MQCARWRRRDGESHRRRKEHHIPVGFPSGNPVEINKHIAQGFRFFEASSDLAMMSAGACDLLSKVPRAEAKTEGKK